MIGTQEWSIHGLKDVARVRPDWTAVNLPAIDGVVIKDVANVVTENGYLTEIWRPQWRLDAAPVGQVFQRVYDGGSTSSWHAHARTSDRLFCAFGRVRVSLFDGRRSSPTFGTSVAIRAGVERPAVIVVPPGVWHAVRNIGESPVVVINVVDAAYDYDDPDVYRLPIDTPLIPTPA
jgi:dTDP-4-dehydrorhamnose 3,5-epimerase